MKYKSIINELTNHEKASLLTGKDFWTTLSIDRLGIRSIVVSDGPTGLRKISDSDNLGIGKSIPATCFPTSSALSMSWNKELCEKVGDALAKEARELDVDIILGPGLNIKRNPLCGRNFEYYSEDPYLTGTLASKLVSGIQENGIGSCIKHFALNNQEYNRLTSSSNASKRTMREIYLTAFEMVIRNANPVSIMSSYNMINGTHSNENEYLLKEVLRKDFGYTGLVMSDWGGSNDRLKGVFASSDLEMPNCKYGIEEVEEALNNGSLDSKYVDECIERILSLRERLDKMVKPKEELNYIDQNDIVYKAALETMVLLKNENKALPLKDNERVCVIGSFAMKPRFQGAGSSLVNPIMTSNILELIGRYNLDYVGYNEGYSRYKHNSNKYLKAATKLAEKSDTILLFLGLDEKKESEGYDRVDMKLPENQINLFNNLKALGKKIVVVIEAGSALELKPILDADAIFLTNLSGQASSDAILDLLTGKVSPSGKLTETYSMSYEDVNTKDNFLKPSNNNYKEGIYVGYRYYDTFNVPVLYPFGYGLSYSSFEYKDLKLSKDKASFTIKNTGLKEAQEIAELYISKKESSVSRPKRELKGFVKVNLPPGEEKEVEILFDEYTFRVYDSLSDKFQIEDGEYEIQIGASLNDIRLKDKVNIEGVKLDKRLDDTYDLSDEEFYKFIDIKPAQGLNFIKKNRIEVTLNTTLSELRYSRSLIGRLMSFYIRHFLREGEGFPVRAIAKFGGFTERKLEGFLVLLNGKFFKGLKLFLSKNRK